MDKEIEKAIREALEQGHSRRDRIRSTYRLQLNAEFTFKHAVAVLPYLKRLGITHVYTSPYLKSRARSMHGYDVIDHSQIDRDLGGMRGFQEFVRELSRNGMGHIADMVPNHVGISQDCSLWWNDVLEHGRRSRYAGYFDIDWRDNLDPERDARLLLPILKEPYAQALRDTKLRLVLGKSALHFQYFDRCLPVSPQSYVFFFKSIQQGSRASELSKLSAQLEETLYSAPPGQYERLASAIKEEAAALLGEEAVRPSAQARVASMNDNPAELDKLLSMQNWRAAWWKAGPDEINYRRFFDVNELAALSMEKDEVFDSTHALILGLLLEGEIDGLRIDHPDGLLNPEEYCRRLQERFLERIASKDLEMDADPLRDYLRDNRSIVEKEPPLYVVVEKILERREKLRDGWSCYGTTGYDFLNRINGLFVDQEGRKLMSEIWKRFSSQHLSPQETVRDSKRYVLERSFPGQFEMLVSILYGLAQRTLEGRDFGLGMIRRCIEEIIVCFPVYRTYITEHGASANDRAIVKETIETAKGRRPDVPSVLFDFAAEVLLDPRRFGHEHAPECRRFSGRFQQLTAPVMAKGVEDTAFYRYLRLLSLNEVGGDLDCFGISQEELHAYLEERATRYPFSLSALSTHDTKRSEDVRARLNVLSEIPERWSAALDSFEGAGASLPGASDISRSDKYLVFQSLLGAWPPGKRDRDESFARRFKAYLLKAVREAKLHSSWSEPNAESERALLAFVDALLDPRTGAAFYSSFLPFQEEIAYYGLLNSLSQTVLRLAAPGIPDTYQGQELWDFSFVDPDNRREVDFGLRERLLNRLESEPATRLDDPLVKLRVTRDALRLRNVHPTLFRQGRYIPARVRGEKAKHIFSFFRKSEDSWACVVVARLYTSICRPGRPPCGETAWTETGISMPPGAPASWVDAFTGAPNRAVEHDGEAWLRVGSVLQRMPVSILVSNR